MTIAVESQVVTFQTNFILAIYNTVNNYTGDSVLLAPLTGVYPNPTYLPGQLLAQYNANAPTPDLVGKFVNFSAASANADQNKAVAILIPSQCNSVGNDGVFWNIAFLTPVLQISGTALANANEAADITAFLIQYPCIQPVPGATLSFSYNGVADQVYIIK